MNIWTAFFLVLSIVILAAPILLSKETLDRNGYSSPDAGKSSPVMEDNELELDLASGRLAREDYEAISGHKSEAEEPDSGAREDHGNFPEG